MSAIQRQAWGRAYLQNSLIDVSHLSGKPVAHRLHGVERVLRGEITVDERGSVEILLVKRVLRG